MSNLKIHYRWAHPALALVAALAASMAHSQIPPESIIMTRAGNSPPVWHADGFNGTTLQLIAPANYSPGNPNVQLKAIFKFASPPPPTPYDNESVELDFDGGAAIPINIATECIRAADRLTLTCAFVRQMPAADASKDFVSARVRYYAWDASTSYYSSLSSQYTQYQGWSANNAMKTLYCAGYVSGSGCTSGGGGGAITPLCNDEAAPIMPNSVAGDGSFIFNFTQSEVCPAEFWIDPPIATKYDYAITGSQFTSITAPSLGSVNDPDGYFLQFPGQGIPAVQLQPGQSHALLQPVSAFQIAGIDPALQLDPADQTAFRLGMTVSAPSGPVTITQKPLVDQPTAPPPPWLLGTQVSLMAMNNSGYVLTKTVTSALEYDDLGYFPLSPATDPTRFDVDVQRDTVRVSFVHPHGMASYGNGMVLNLFDLKPDIRDCNGPGVITGATTTTSKSDATYTVSGTTFTDDRLNIALAPPSGVYDWSKNDWIETKLTFGCPAGSANQQQSGSSPVTNTEQRSEKPRSLRDRAERRIRETLRGNKPRRQDD